MISYTIIILIGALLAGFVGALTGLGGGIIIIPLLTLGLGYDMNYAIGAALVSVVATSTGAATAYIKEGVSNMKIAMYLLVATTIGAIIGALIGANAPTSVLSITFGLILCFTAVMSFVKKGDNIVVPKDDSPAAKWQLQGVFSDKGKEIHYEATNIWSGFFMMLFAGIMSGLLGIGSGVLKVIAMDNFMKLPFKVSTTTSVLMIGVTAIASAVIYLQKGYIVPDIAAPVLLGVICGAKIGSKVLPKINTILLKKIFAVIVTIVAIQMIYRGLNS